MPASKCESCDLLMPIGEKECHVCQGKTTQSPTLVCPYDWHKEVKKRQAVVIAPPDDEYEVIKEVPDVIMVYKEGGRLWVNQVDLSRRGVVLSHLKSFDLLEMNGVVYELQGWHFSKRRWWIDRVVPVAAP